MTAFRLSPSYIARYFYHECDRYLRFHATAAEDRKNQGLPSPERSESLATWTFLRRGYDWEEEVVGKRLKGQVRIARGIGSVHERIHGARETLKILQQLDPEEYIYQPTLEVPASFLSRNGLDPHLCQFPPCRPDLLKLEIDGRGNRCLKVIDIKASDEFRTSHLIQTALYALILREVLQEERLNTTVDLDEIGIWLYEADKPEWHPLNTSLRTVERFLREHLPRILTQPLEEVPWHLFFRCEWCDFYQHCRDEAEKTDSVSLLPYLSVGGRRYLHGAGWGGEPIHTLKDFQDFLNGADQGHIDDTLNACGNLRNRRERLRNGIEALRKKQVVSHGGSSLAMPINEQVKIVLNLQGDPYSGEIYAAGLFRLKGKAVYGDGSKLQCFIAAKPEDCTNIRTQFLKALFEELRKLHDYNSQMEWREQKSLQAYVFDSYELSLFNRLLLEALDDPDLAPCALQLLFFFQDEGLANQHQHPEPEVPYPIVVLTQVIRQMVAIPTPLVLRLPEVLKVLPAPRFDYTLKPNNLFWFELSNTMKSDALALAWHGERTEAIGWIEKELEHRLRAASTVVDGLRERVKEHLFAWPPKFLFPSARTFQHTEFSQLAFIVRYEAFMAGLGIRNQRTSSWEERLREGISIPLQNVGGNRWKVLEPLDVSLIEENPFPNRLIVPYGPHGEQEQMGYNDYRNRKALYSPKNRAIWVAAVTDMEVPDGGPRVSHLYMDIKGKHTFTTGSRAVVHPRFTDWNSDRIIDCLVELDTQPDNGLLQLIRNPSNFANVLEEPSNIKKTLKQLSKKGLTSSQNEAFRQLAYNRLTLVWGPPGTGKTYFLARAILSLVRAYDEAGYVLWIGVTAFTHAAIENLLLEIEKVALDMGLKGFLPVYKLGQSRTQQGRQSLSWLSETQANTLSPEESMVLGGTVYSLRKVREATTVKFDLLIVDEASQMKFGEFALAFPSLEPEVGRLVLAGDDLQLPPIINGQYPERDDGLPGLHDSVFAYLRVRDNPNSPYTRQLSENWRMNTTLCRFPAQTLYGENYQPADKVSTRRIELAPRRGKTGLMPELMDWMLDPNYPLVVGMLDGIQATTENKLEAELVAHLACTLRAQLKQASGRTYPNSDNGDNRFWQDGLFIVSPHHAQIYAIQRELHDLKTWRSTPFVDTVDKMQGQQAQSVIVSYGVSDPETALQEAEFIYGLNRLNVAITRAQAKCIIFLPRPLLEPSLDLLRHEKAAQGLGFMQALVDYCAAGEQQEFRLKTSRHGIHARLQALRVS